MRSFLCITLAVAFMLCTVPAMAEKPAVPADGIKMSLTKKPVVFNHSTHTTVTCEQCHHPVNDKADYRKCSTAGCHDILGAKAQRIEVDGKKQPNINSYYRIIHDKKGTKYPTCLNCHITTAKAEPAKKKELTSCKGSKCHP